MTSNNYNLKQLKESQVIQQKILESNEAKIVVLKPIGYPIECSLVETPLIEIPHHEILDHIYLIKN